MSDNLRGAVLMMASMALFTLNDMCTKLLAGQVPLTQVITLRGIFTTVATAIIAWRMGAFRTRPSARDTRLILVRVVAELGAAYFFLTALFNMPLANVTAVLQSAPLVVTLAAALFLGEKVGWRRMVAIVAGFVGVLIIVRPGPEGFNIFAGYTLVAVLFVTLRDLVTRQLSRDVPSMQVSFATAAGVTLFFGLLGVGGEDWVPLDTRSATLILAAGVAVLGAYLSSVGAMRAGELSFVSPFRYTSLLWALVLGFLAFGDFPTPTTLVGAGVVVGSGLFMLYRERQLGLRPTAPHKSPRA